MSVFFVTLWAVIVVLGVFLVWINLLPNKLSYSCERIIDGVSVADAFGAVSDFNQWRHWSPWVEMDPAQDLETGGQAGETGAWMYWDSELCSPGRGKQVLRDQKPGESVKIEMDFFEDGKFFCHLTFQSLPNAVKIIWGLEYNMGSTFEKAFMLYRRRINKRILTRGLGNLARHLHEKAVATSMN